MAGCTCEPLLRFCQTSCKVPFYLLQTLLALLALALAASLSYLVIEYDSLLVGYFFLFSLPAILLCTLLLFTNIFGCHAVRKQKKPFLIVSIILLTLLMIAALICALAMLILAGYFTTIPFAGDYFTELGFQFKLQVFNECCVGLENTNNTVNACGEFSTQLPLCFDGDKEWSDLVSDDLCIALKNIESESFVGNNTCGGGDADLFIDDFTAFVEKNLNYAAMSLMVFSIVLIITWVTSIFQCCAIQVNGPIGHAGSLAQPVNYKMSDEEDGSQVAFANFGGGGRGGTFLEAPERDPEDFL